MSCSESSRTEPNPLPPFDGAVALWWSLLYRYRKTTITQCDWCCMSLLNAQGESASMAELGIGVTLEELGRSRGVALRLQRRLRIHTTDFVKKHNLFTSSICALSRRSHTLTHTTLSRRSLAATGRTLSQHAPQKKHATPQKIAKVPRALCRLLWHDKNSPLLT